MLGAGTLGLGGCAGGADPAAAARAAAAVRRVLALEQTAVARFEAESAAAEAQPEPTSRDSAAQEDATAFMLASVRRHRALADALAAIDLGGCPEAFVASYGAFRARAGEHAGHSERSARFVATYLTQELDALDRTAPETIAELERLTRSEEQAKRQLRRARKAVRQATEQLGVALPEYGTAVPWG